MKLPSISSARTIAIAVVGVAFVATGATVGIKSALSSRPGVNASASKAHPNPTDSAGSPQASASKLTPKQALAQLGYWKNGRFILRRGPQRPASFYTSLYDFVNVSVPEDESWGGSDCRVPRQGSHCTILFEGITLLAHDTKGTIAFQVKENGAALPRTIDTMPARQYKTPVYRWVKYNVPGGVTYVTTQVVLLNAKGVPVAFGHPQDFPISS